MAENSRAVVLNVLVEPDAIAGLGQKIGERSLADFERVAAETVAVPVRFALCEARPPNRPPDGRPQTAGRSTGPSLRAPARLRPLSRRAPRSPHRATPTRRAREPAHRLR